MKEESPRDGRASSLVEKSYDTVAGEYARRIFDELAGKPFDRALLDRFAADVGPGRALPVCDLGCGPGQVARYLRDRGVTVMGIDLSAGMVRLARALSPDIEFHQGDMRALALPDGSLEGICAFYSLIHLQRTDISPALVELHRVLAPGAPIVIAFHVGKDTVHLDEWWGHEVAIDFQFFEPADVQAELEAANFTIEDAIERDPYPDVEHPSRRAYLMARKRR